MAEGFKMGAAFVDVTTEDNTQEGRSKIGATMAKWAGGLAVGALISKGISDNLDIGEANAKLAAQLNLTKDVADKAGKLSGQIYRDNFGESIPAVNEAIASVGQSLYNLNTASETNIKAATEAALGLANVFGTEVSENVRAASALITNRLAPDSAAAFDLMTRAFQMGGNKAGDLLETITEYSPQFHKLGLDGATALGLLSQGLQAGARDTDVIADAFKEFSLRAIDNSTLTIGAFKSLGFNAQDMMQKIAAGGPTAQQGLLDVLTALQNMKDPVAQNTAGVALFGTQWEDTLRQILPNMDLTEAALTDVKGATDRMNKAASDTAKNGIESVKRQMEGWLTAVTSMDGPLGAITSWAAGFGGMALPLITQLATIGAAFSQMGLLAEGGALRVVGSWIAMAAASVTNAAIMAASWLVAFWPLVLIVAAVVAVVLLVISQWDYIKTQTMEIWNAIVGWLTGIWDQIVAQVQGAINMVLDAWSWLSSLPGRVGEWFQGVVNSAAQKIGDLINWVKSIPGKILSALGDLGSLLWNAGKRIIEGFFNGLKAMWNTVTGWISGIGDWISAHKGPIEVDAVLLVPHGSAIMKGLSKGLQAEFNANVKPTVEGMAGQIADTRFAAPSIAPGTVPSTTPAGASTVADSSQAGAVHIENLHVSFPGSLNAMSRTDLRAAVDFLDEQLRTLNRSRVGAAS
jgi:hypothetical protein